MFWFKEYAHVHPLSLSPYVQSIFWLKSNDLCMCTYICIYIYAHVYMFLQHRTESFDLYVYIYINIYKNTSINLFHQQIDGADGRRAFRARQCDALILLRARSQNRDKYWGRNSQKNCSLLILPSAGTIKLTLEYFYQQKNEFQLFCESDSLKEWLLSCSMPSRRIEKAFFKV